MRNDPRHRTAAQALCWCLLAASLLAVSPGNGQQNALTILHTNDLRGRLLPGEYYEEKDRGGMASVIHLLHSLRAPNSLVLDGGDALGPELLSQFDSGRLMVELMNAAGYDAMVVGNHDFAYGLDDLLDRAAAADFALLAANLVRKGTDELLLEPYALIEKNGVRVLVIGLVSPRIIKLINPLKVDGIAFTDPAAALKKTLAEAAEKEGPADLTIALVHMTSPEVESLVHAFPGVHLFVAGGFDLAQEKDGNLHLVQTAAGNRIVSTPGSGAHVGRIDLVAGDPTAFTATLLPVGPGTPPDLRAATRIAQHQTDFRRARREPVGTVQTAIDTPYAFVARLMRHRLDTEVALINRGALRDIALKDTVRLRALDRLVRFDDLLVRLELSGKELKGLAASSKTRSKDGQRLVFAGYVPGTNRVNGRALEDDETYTVATTGYLANGGDGYLQNKTPLLAPPALLKQTVATFLARPEQHLKGMARTGSAWKLRAKINNTLTWTARNDQADLYKGPLGGRDALAWSSVLDARTIRANERGTLTADLKTSFGQLRTDGRLQESADRIDADLVYTLQTAKTPPFVGLNAKSVWTVPAGEERPLTLRATAGLQRDFGPRLKTRWGLAVERDFAAKSNRAGIELTPEYRRPLPGGNELKSNTKLFFAVTDPRSASAQSYNTLLLRLWGNLNATVDANFFYQWDNKIDETGLKSEIQVGLGYAWNRKWAR